MKRALLIGSTGQDGTYLGRFLEGKGYEVRGVHGSSPLDITRAKDVAALVEAFRPDEAYHLAARHASSEAREEALGLEIEEAYGINFHSLAHLLEAVRTHAPSCRVFYAASSHVFDGGVGTPQDETTPMDPRSVYAMTKADGRRLCGLYRERYGLFTSVGILYGHESPLRPRGFLSRRVVEGALKIAGGGRDPLVVGDLSVDVDWGWAPEYVEAMHAMLQLAKGGDFIVASGKGRPVSEFVAAVFEVLGLDWRRHVQEDPALLRRRGPRRIGDPSRLRAASGWSARMGFEAMASALVEAARAGEPSDG